ncbi:ATP-binding cassette domain-containing protein [Candidatus Bipolaricaulota bacterium]
MQPSDRVALVGPNGSGKSTLVRHIVEQIDLPGERIICIPQEISAEESAEALRAVRALSSEDLGSVMAWVSRLGSEPARLLSSELPSPGEVRKLILARYLAMEPHLIVMDEPTNHMDLPSIECVEAALAEFPGGLLLVSHDEVFLEALTTTRWEIEPEDPSRSAFSLRVRSARCTNQSAAGHSHTREVG